MLTLEQLLKELVIWSTILGTLLTLLKGFADIYRTLKPSFGPLFFAGSILVPQGLIIWFYLYLAATNANRIGDNLVFIYIVVQLIVFTSAYTFIWGKYFYPKLNRWLRSQPPNSEVQNYPQKQETKKRGGATGRNQ